MIDLCVLSCDQQPDSVLINTPLIFIFFLEINERIGSVCYAEEPVLEKV